MKKQLLCLVLMFALLLTALVPAAFAEAEPVNIRFVNFWVPEEMTQTYPVDIVNAYLAAHPNVKLEWESYSGSDLQGVIFQTQAAANDMPDLFMINSLNMRQAVVGNLLEPWDDVIAANKEWADSLIDGWSETTFDGVVYGVPFQFITNECVYYNKDMLTKYGYDKFPETWDEMFEYGQKLKADGIVPIALGNVDGWPAYSNIAEILCEYYCGPEWVKAIGAFDPKASYDSEGFLNVLKLEKRIMDELLNEDSVAINNNTDDKNYLYSEEAAMLLGGSYTLQGILDNAPEGFMSKIGVAPIPRPNDAIESVPGGIFTGGSGWELAMRKGLSDEQKAVCVDIVKALTGAEYARNDLENGKIPVLKSEHYPEYDQSKVSEQMKELTSLISAAPQLTLMNQQQQGSMSTVLYKMLQEIQAGTKTPEEAAKAIQESYSMVAASLQ